MGKMGISGPRYQQIAADVAAKIVDGNYKVGSRIYARSALASQYGVSAETARRAVCVLSDLGIVESVRGSGVIIKSYDKAVQFIRLHRDIETIADIRQELMSSVERQTSEIQVFSKCLSRLVEKIERFRTINPFVPFQIAITKETPHLNKTSAEINFWQNTFSTIIAIRRDDTLILSPGPYAAFKEGDTLFFIGEDACFERVTAFMYP
jgi:K+/H+ antiporter YhaU regulatory subunit KhtT